MINGHSPDPKARLKALAQNKLAIIEDQVGPVLGLPPWHSRLVAMSPEGAPVFGVCDRTGATAIDQGLDPISAQLIAWAATRRAGVQAIACLWSPP